MVISHSVRVCYRLFKSEYEAEDMAKTSPADGRYDHSCRWQTKIIRLQLLACNSWKLFIKISRRFVNSTALLWEDDFLYYGFNNIYESVSTTTSVAKLLIFRHFQQPLQIRLRNSYQELCPVKIERNKASQLRNFKLKYVQRKNMYVAALWRCALHENALIWTTWLLMIPNIKIIVLAFLLHF